MKQLIIAKNKSYTSEGKYTDISKVADGVLAFLDPHEANKVIKSKTDLGTSFSIVCGRGTDKMPFYFPEVDVKSLSVEKAVYTAGKKFKANITIPTTEKGKEYTVVLSKCGVVFNERNLWSYTALAKSTLAADVAHNIVKSINANTQTSGLTATNSGGTITVEAVEEGIDFNIYGADELMGVKPTNVIHGVKSILDGEYVRDLASRCAAGKGFNYLAENGVEIYPGYPEAVEDDSYVMFTFRFAVPRVASKQRDEVVWQLVHIVMPVGSGVMDTIDSIFADHIIDPLSLRGDKKVEVEI